MVRAQVHVCAGLADYSMADGGEAEEKGLQLARDIAQVRSHPGLCDLEC